MTDATLAERQTAFMRAILDEQAPLPDGWGNSQAAGMSVYRGNYRSALMDALASTFERTSRYVGEAAFKQASAHHAICHPPSGWTIDEAGRDFDTTCAALFGENPEVAELAWLEWAMLEVSTSAETACLDPQGFGAATAEFDDEDWMGLKIEVQPRVSARVVDHDLAAMWNALAEEGLVRPDPRLASPKGCLVWREGERPTFLLVDPGNARALAAMQQGAGYGDVIALLAGADPDPETVQDAAMRAGSFLGNWLQEGLIVSLKT
ncbi:MAG: DNA-binding domain-containing protein [Erythrobacter sp.]|nr:DNA-binding domain-containing protein [Erythrobacter sp.]